MHWKKCGNLDRLHGKCGNKVICMTNEQFAKKIRIHAVEMAHYSHESHVASALSMCDIVAVLYNKVLRIFPENPDADERDRFILSKGHACSAVYGALAERGFLSVEELKYQCQNGSRLSGHITCANVPGVELSTGSLGHGCCVAAGMALNGKMKEKSYRVYALIGDGECDEGSVWEMALFAHQYKLGNLCIIVDHNKMQAMGFCEEVASHIDLAAKWKAFGWNVQTVDGHNCDEIERVLKNMQDDIPTCVIANTIKGKGVSFMENNLLWHYRDPQGNDYEKAMNELEDLDEKGINKQRL